MFVSPDIQGIPALWPFADVWSDKPPSGDLRERPPSAADRRKQQYLREAVALLWSLQESLHFPRSTTAALVHAVMATLAEHPELPQVSNWLDIIHAQQAALAGEFDVASRMLQKIHAHLHAETGPPALALAIEVMGWYRLAHLICRPHHGVDHTLPHIDDVRERYRYALTPSLSSLARLAEARQQLPTSVRAHVARISVVAQACTQQRVMRDEDWGYLLRDALQAESDLQRVHATWALGLAYRLQNNESRAQTCLMQAKDAALRLGW